MTKFTTVRSLLSALANAMNLINPDMENHHQETAYTRLILMDIEGFEEIADWAGFHHEKLNGRGYPFHFDSGFLSLGSRIMTVADIFSAITEERPYRKPMSREQAMKVMWENVERGEICRDIVQLLEDNYDAVNDARKKKSQEAGARYFATHQTERTE